MLHAVCRRYLSAPLVSSLLALLSWCMPLCAQEAVEVGEIIVTAHRDAEDPWDVPASTTVITAEEISTLGTSSIPEALEKLAGIHVRSATGAPSYAQLDLRGFGEQSHGKVLVLLDGKRLNPPDMSQIDWLQIPVADIERIEVVRGAQTVLYGDNAIAGVVNIITRRVHEKRGVELSLLSGSEGTLDARVVWRETAGPLSSSLTGQYASDAGWRDRSAWWRRGASLTLTYQKSDRLRLSFDALTGTADYQLPGFLTEEQMHTNPRQAGNPSDDVRTWNRQVSIGAEGQIAPDQRWKAELSIGEKESQTNMDSYWAWSNVELERIGFSPRYILQRPIAGRENKLIAGVDYERSPVDSIRFDGRDRHTPTAFATVVRETLGSYIHNEARLSDNLLLTLGYRFETGSISAVDDEVVPGTQYSDSKHFSGSAAHAGLCYQWGRQAKVYLTYGRVFRYPFTDEIAYYQGFLGGPWPGTIFFNKDLRPERGYSIDIGGEIRPADNLQINLSLFSTSLTDEIYYNPLTGLNENLYRTRRQGVELSCRYAVADRCSLSFGYTWIDPEFRDGPYAGKTVPLAPGQKAFASIDLSLPAGVSVQTSVSATGDSYLGSDFDNDQPKLPGYAVVDILCHLRPAGLQKNSGHLFVGVKNAFDRRFSSLGFDWGFMNVYYPAQGRTVVAGGSFTF